MLPKNTTKIETEYDLSKENLEDSTICFANSTMYKHSTKLLAFLEDGQYKSCGRMDFGTFPLFGHGSERAMYFLRDNCFYKILNKYTNSMENWVTNLHNDLVIPSGILMEDIHGGTILVRFADEEDSYESINCKMEDSMPIWIGTKAVSMTTFSIVCLTRLLYDIKEGQENTDLVRQTITDLTNGSIKIVDFTKEDYKSVSSSGIKRYRENPETVPAGYTIVAGDFLHRPGTVVLKDTETDIYYLLGQDESAYFGCELPESSPIKSVSQALNVLAPKEAIKNGRVDPRAFRQGEWFAIPQDLYMTSDLTGFYRGKGRLDLPRHDPNSATHTIKDGDFTKGPYNDYEMLIRPESGQVYARNFTMVHSEGDHDSMYVHSCDRFYLLAENRAVQSVSVEGVD